MNGSSFEQTWIPFTQRCIVAGLIDIGPVVLEKKIFKFRQCIFCYFVIISTWERAGPFIWTNLNPLHPRIHCVKLVWKLTHWFLRRFLNFFNVFLLFRNCLPMGKDRALIWTNLNSLQHRMLCAKFGWNWFSGSGEEDF